MYYVLCTRSGYDVVVNTTNNSATALQAHAILGEVRESWLSVQYIFCCEIVLLDFYGLLMKNYPSHFVTREALSFCTFCSNPLLSNIDIYAYSSAIKIRSDDYFDPKLSFVDICLRRRESRKYSVQPRLFDRTIKPKRLKIKSPKLAQRPLKLTYLLTYLLIIPNFVLDVTSVQHIYWCRSSEFGDKTFSDWLTVVTTCPAFNTSKLTNANHSAVVLRRMRVMELFRLSSRCVRQIVKQLYVRDGDAWGKRREGRWWREIATIHWHRRNLRGVGGFLYP